MLRLTLALLALAAAPPAAAQQRLFALDSTAQIWRVDGHLTMSATLRPVVQVSLSPGYLARDLAFDPGTQRFLVLATDGAIAAILEVDAFTAITTTRCTLPGTLVDGLDRRSDGVLAFEDGLDELVLIDPAGCVDWRVPLPVLLGVHTSSASVAFDARGYLESAAPDGTRYELDPLTGDATSPAFPAAWSAHALEIDADGARYVGEFQWSLVRVDVATGQFTQVGISNAPPPPVRLVGLALAEPADGLGITFECGGLPNSTGRASTLELLGEAVVGGGVMELRCRDVPPGSSGYFLMGPTSGSLPVASGVLCIGSPVFRNSLAVQFAGQDGVVRQGFGLTALPVGLPLQPGDSHVFQYWHRDLGSTANFSAARRVTFR